MRHRLEKKTLHIFYVKYLRRDEKKCENTTEFAIFKRVQALTTTSGRFEHPWARRWTDMLEVSTKTIIRLRFSRSTAYKKRPLTPAHRQHAAPLFYLNFLVAHDVGALATEKVFFRAHVGHFPIAPKLARLAVVKLHVEPNHSFKLKRVPVRHANRDENSRNIQMAWMGRSTDRWESIDQGALARSDTT